MSKISNESQEEAGQQTAPEGEPEWPEAAPTDLRRHFWLLVLILAVVALAGLLGFLADTAVR